MVVEDNVRDRDIAAQDPPQFWLSMSDAFEREAAAQAGTKHQESARDWAVFCRYLHDLTELSGSASEHFANRGD